MSTQGKPCTVSLKGALSGLTASGQACHLTGLSPLHWLFWKLSLTMSSSSGWLGTLLTWKASTQQLTEGGRQAPAARLCQLRCLLLSSERPRSTIPVSQAMADHQSSVKGAEHSRTDPVVIASAAESGSSCPQEEMQCSGRSGPFHFLTHCHFPNILATDRAFWFVSSHLRRKVPSSLSVLCHFRMLNSWWKCSAEPRFSYCPFVLSFDAV